MKHDAIAVIDFGGQYAHLIATKLRKLNVLAEIRQPEDPSSAFEKFKGIVISGSPSLSSHGEDSAYNKAIFDLGIPIIGFCFGHQEMAKHYGGKVVHGGREWGRADLHIVRDHPLFRGLEKVERVWMSHFDSVAELGPNFEELGYTALGKGEEKNRFAAIGSDKLKRYGLQFHPEVDDTTHGRKMLANFVFEICGCKPSWTVDNYLTEQIDRVRRQAGARSVFLLISGGVDSAVAAKLFSMALGPERLCLLHVDNGLMRKDESKNVLKTIESLGLARSLHFADASDDFLDALQGVVDPEKKRSIIGNVFVEVFRREAKKLGIQDHILGQGTIYPDTIETGGTKRADTIKTHHNRVPIIEEMIAKGEVIEPLSELYKVEVRELGERLGMDGELLGRHPFPGPGLAVRLLCSDGRENRKGFEDLEPKAQKVARSYGLVAKVLPLCSVGVKGDVRTYENPVMFSGDAPWDALVEASGAVFKQVLGINRCVWNLGSAAPRRTRLLPATVTRQRLDLLRQADHLVMQGLKRHGVYDKTWQCPTVMAPLEIDGRGGELVVIRPIHSERAMTAMAAELPLDLIAELKRSILSLPGVSGLAIDLTSKPPGTIEWE